ncbi:MAG: hypothetical protein HYR75_09115 [Gemmatimonadetes bacterium]|nr:hypothetical protein [Gemmatimonadota bacterium]
MHRLTRSLLSAAGLALVLSHATKAQDLLLKPFTLGSKGPGTVAQKAADARAALVAQGFTIAGEYQPYPNADIIVVTNDELKATAAKSERGAFGAAVRVSVTSLNDTVQVAYTNPVYMANAYRMAGDLSSVATRLAAALWRQEDFGAKGLKAKSLRSYHYTFGMEHFDEPSVLAEYASFDEAVAKVEAGLAAARGGVTKVYRIDIPERKEAVFGVAMKAPTEADRYMDDQFIMSVIDFKDLRSTAHLPYEILVSGNTAYALYARFRIAISFPDLSMMGGNSFMKIMKSPEAIRKALVRVAGGNK